MLTLISNFNCICMRLSHSSFYLFGHYISVADGYFSVGSNFILLSTLEHAICAAAHTHTHSLPISWYFWCFATWCLPFELSRCFNHFLLSSFIRWASFLIRFLFAWNIIFSREWMLLVSPVFYNPFFSRFFHFKFLINFSGIVQKYRNDYRYIGNTHSSNRRMIWNFAPAIQNSQTTHFEMRKAITRLFYFG